MTEQLDTAAIREQVCDLCDWPRVQPHVAIKVIEDLCDALDEARAERDGLEQNAESWMARAEAAEAERDDEKAWRISKCEVLVARAEKAEARVVELERRLSPGQGEGYANEVERQRAVIEQFVHIARAQKARIARVEKELDRHRTPIPLPGGDGCSAVVVDVSAVRRALAVPPGDTVPFDF